MTSSDRQTIAFQDAKELGEWLARLHQSARKFPIHIFEARSGRLSVTWTDRVIEAIRFAWIDERKLPLERRRTCGA